MMFSFGDYDWVSNNDTAKEIETYLKTVWTCYLKIQNTIQINERFAYKLFESEIRDFEYLKKNMKDVDDFKEVEYGISFIPNEVFDDNVFNENSTKIKIEIDDSSNEEKESESSEEEIEPEPYTITLK